MGATEELLMSMADEARDSVSYEVRDSGIAYLNVDPDTRKISIPHSETTFGVMTDEDSERKYFRCPRIVGDNLDLSQHKIYISYVSTNSNTIKELPDADGRYWCDDVAVDGDYITFSWKLSGNVFKTPGFVAFKVLACTSDGNIDKTRWNTAPAYGTILMTIPDGDDIAERYPDVINQIIAKLEAIEEPSGTAATKVSEHNMSNTAHDDIRALITKLETDKADKSYVVSIFEQLKELIQTGEITQAVALLDSAILDLSTLA